MNIEHYGEWFAGMLEIATLEEIQEFDMHPIGGGLGGGGGGDQTVLNKSEPWGPAQPGATDVLDYAQNWLMPRWIEQQAYEPYQGDRIADFSPQQLMAQQFITNNALDPSNWNQGMNQAQGLMSGDLSNRMGNEGVWPSWNQAIKPTMEGQYNYAESNPYLRSAMGAATDPLYENLMNKVLPGLNSTAQEAGRAGSDTQALLQRGAIGDTQRQAGNIMSQMAMQNLGSERQLQMNAANVPIQMMQNQQQLELQGSPLMQSWLDQIMQQTGMLSGVGEEQQKLAQAQLGADRQYWEEGINQPYNLLSSLGNLFFSGGQLGGIKSTTTPYYSPSLGESLLGGASSGLGAYGQYGNLISSLLGGK